MSSERYIKNVAIAGASGNLGIPTVNALLSEGTYNIRILTRSSSTATFPNDPRITISKGDYDSATFLELAFKNQEALIFTWPLNSYRTHFSNLITAAAKSGVKWIIPAEYGFDFDTPEVLAAVPGMQVVKGRRGEIEDLAKMYKGLSWTGVVTNPWLDMNLKGGGFSFDIPARKAILFHEGKSRFNTTTIRTVALGLARLVALPLTSTTRVSLSNFTNKQAYFSSFLVSQAELLASVQRATGTSPGDWTIQHQGVEGLIENGKLIAAEGNYIGNLMVLFGMMYRGDGLGDYESRVGLDNGALRLEREDLDEIVREAVLGTKNE